MLPETVETDSLVLRPLDADHVDPFDLYECYRASREGVGAVFEHVPQEPFDTPKDAHDWLVDAADEWDEAAAAKYGAFVRETGALAGTAALSLDWDRRGGSLGVILDRDHWGNGYAGECAMALAEVAFDRLDLETVTIGFETGNERSRSVVEEFVDSLGGRKEGVLRNATPIDDRLVDHHRYSVTREEWDRASDGD